MTTRSLKTLIVIALALALGAGLGIWITTGSEHTANAAANNLQTQATSIRSSIKPAPETASQAIAGQQQADQYLGVIFPRQSADIVAQSDGRLEAVYANLGDNLKAGDIIARVESSSITRQLEMAESSFSSAQAEQHNAEIDLKEAELRYDRRKTLAEVGVISKEELATARVQFEKANAALEVARAHVAEQMARVKQVKESLAHTVIKATFEGTVAARYLDAGAAVNSGAPIISLIRLNDLWVRFAIPETKQATLSIGSTISFYIEGMAVAIPGVIEHVSPGVAAMSQELVVEARLKIPSALSGQIKPGGSGLVSLDSRFRRP